MEVKWGLIPDMSISRTLPRLVSIDVAKELTFTGRVFSGFQAHELGVVTRLDEDPLTAARELAAQIAEQSPDAVRAAKRLYNEAWTGSAQETLALEAELQLRAGRDARTSWPRSAPGSPSSRAEFVDPVVRLAWPWSRPTRPSEVDTGEQGLEPQLRRPERRVLPLHHSPVY